MMMMEEEEEEGKGGQKRKKKKCSDLLWWGERVIGRRGRVAAVWLGSCLRASSLGLFGCSFWLSIPYSSIISSSPSEICAGYYLWYNCLFCPY
jgi:hypothetical protein